MARRKTDKAKTSSASGKAQSMHAVYARIYNEEMETIRRAIEMLEESQPSDLKNYSDLIQEFSNI